MSNFPSYPTRSFSETQKFFVLDPQTGTPSFVLGSDLVDFLTPGTSFVFSESTRVSAQASNYKVGNLIQTAGAVTEGDGLASGFLVVPGGEGDFAMQNGNDLLVIRGDDLLREQLKEGVVRMPDLSAMESTNGRFDGDAARLVSGTGRDGDFRWDSSDLSSTLVLASATSDSVDDTTNTINDADHPFSDGDGVITQTTVNGLTAHTVYWVVNSTSGSYQLSATFGGGAVDLTGTTSVTIDKLLDPRQGIWVTPSSDKTGASGAWARQYGQNVMVKPAVNSLWFGAGVGDAVLDTASMQAAIDTGYDVYSPSGTYVFTNDTTLGRVLRLKTPNQRIFGDGKFRTIFKMSDRDADGNLYQDDGVNNPDGFVAMFSNFEQDTDVSGVEIFDLCLDYNGAQNKLIRGYGNDAGIEPLEGVYPGTSGTGFARFRAAVYIQKGSGVNVHDCQLKDWPRVSVLLEGPNVGDIQDSHAYRNDVVVTETNPGSNDWDSTGILIMGDECSANDNRFINRSAGTDYYTARTTIQISGRNAHATGNKGYRWYRAPLIGNGGYDAVSDAVICSDNTMYLAKRNVQLLSRSGTVVTSGAALRSSTVTDNVAYLDVSTMGLNGSDTQVPTGVSMLEIESLGLDALTIHDNLNYFEAGATTGQSGVTFSPTGAGTQNLKKLSVKNNVAVNPPRNGVSITFADTVEDFVVEGNETHNPGQRSDATGANLAGVQIRGQMNRGSASANKTFDTRATHKVSAAVWLNASAGSGSVECLDNNVFLAAGVFDMPIVENENSNIDPLIRAQSPAFIAPSSVASPGSTIIDTTEKLTYTSGGGLIWTPRISEGLAINSVTFADGDSTPDVKGYSWAKALNGAATTITDFDNGHEGQRFDLHISENNTTIQNNANIITASGSDIATAAGTVVSFRRFDGVWRQTQ